MTNDVLLGVRGLWKAFDAHSVLRGLDLDVHRHQAVVLIGASGSGKSSLARALVGVWPAARGSLRLDGATYDAWDRTALGRAMGYLPQTVELFEGTVAQNIARFCPDMQPEAVIAAARAAHAHEFILRLPQGYDSLVGERGQGLSGGERQRISIARALLINPRILILDEATSAVDTETEKEIQRALDNLVRGRTTIAIAHRLSTLRKADRLVVMDKGVVVEEGSHDELIEAQGAYWRLYEAQQRQAEAEAVLGGSTETQKVSA